MTNSVRVGRSMATQLREPLGAILWRARLDFDGGPRRRNFPLPALVELKSDFIGSRRVEPVLKMDRNPAAMPGGLLRDRPIRRMVRRKTQNRLRSAAKLR